MTLTRRTPQLKLTIGSGWQNTILQLKKCSLIFFYNVFNSSYAFLEDIPKAQNFVFRLYTGSMLVQENSARCLDYFFFKCLPYSSKLSLTPVFLSFLIMETWRHVCNKTLCLEQITHIIHQDDFRLVKGNIENSFRWKSWKCYNFHLQAQVYV